MMQEIPGNQPANGESDTQNSGKKHIPEQVEVISDTISRCSFGTLFSGSRLHSRTVAAQKIIAAE